LFVVTLVATIAAYLYMRTTTVKAGADFVVLTMSVAITLAFSFAVLNKLLRIGLLSVLAEQVIFVMVPPLALIFLVLGTIFIGVATPTEGGAMGAVGSLALAMLKRRLTWQLIRQAAEATAKLSAFVVFILIGARVFSLTFWRRWTQMGGGPLLNLPGGQIGFLIRSTPSYSCSLSSSISSRSPSSPFRSWRCRRRSSASI
jgi:TRAP-type mannitol/chloroaromatic compound transport system permease large subunit